MWCKRCRIKMIEQKRSYHKRRKWVCPQCGGARMQQARPAGRKDTQRNIEHE